MAEETLRRRTALPSSSLVRREPRSSIVDSDSETFDQDFTLQDEDLDAKAEADTNDDSPAGTVVISREVSSTDTYLGCEIFPIYWDKLRFASNNNLVVPTVASIGYRIIHRRQHSFTGKASSFIWRFGADLAIQFTPQGEKQRYWLCRLCHTRKIYNKGLYQASGTRPQARHLRNSHLIDKNGNPITSSQTAIGKFLIRGHPPGNWDFNTHQQMTFINAYIDWIIVKSVSFRAAASEEMIALFQLIRVGTESLFYTTHSSLSRLVCERFQERFCQIQLLMKTAKSVIHFSNDMWSATNGLSLLGVVSHFLDKGYQHRTVLVGLKRVWGSHDGVNMARSVVKLLGPEGYDLDEAHIGAFVMDNASSNDSMIHALQFTYESSDFSRRLRCAGHIFNLVVKAILFGKGLTSFSAAILGCSDADAFNEWRKFGPIGRVHNTVQYIMRSDQRRQAFLSYQQGAEDGAEGLFEATAKLLVQDGGVRWNSTHAMLMRALRLRLAIEKFQKKHAAGSPDQDGSYSADLDKITITDWDVVRQYLTILYPFIEATRALEGNGDEDWQGTRGFTSEVFLWMQKLYNGIEAGLEKAEEGSALDTSLKLGKDKLEVYWLKMIEDTHYYYASIILHPSRKLAWFKDHWRSYPTWVKKVEDGMKKFMVSYMQRHAAAAQTEDDIPRVKPRKTLSAAVMRSREEAKALGIYDSDEDNNAISAVRAIDYEYSNQNHRSKKTTRAKTPYEVWLTYPPLEDEVDSPLDWWIHLARNPETCAYPELIPLALDLFSAPAMSSQCERTFSQAKRIITDERNRLGPEVIEALECQKNWVDHGLVTSELKEAVGKLDRQ